MTCWSACSPRQMWTTAPPQVGGVWGRRRQWAPASRVFFPRLLIFSALQVPRQRYVILTCSLRIQDIPCHSCSSRV